MNLIEMLILGKPDDKNVAKSRTNDVESRNALNPSRFFDCIKLIRMK